jgi:hypothetical protein
MRLNTKAFARHGDVFIHRVTEGDTSSANFKSNKTFTLAYGEKTGHHHTLFPTAATGVIEVDEKAINDGVLFTVNETTELKHQEHETITLEPGTYVAIIQEEYDSADHTRKVID